MKQDNAQSSFGWHRWATFMSCPQKYSYSYLQKLSTIRDPAPIAAGSLFHKGHEHYRLGQLHRECLDPFEAMKTASHKYAYAYPRVEPIFRAWMRRYQVEDFTVLDTEKEFAISIGGYPYTCRIDLVALQDEHVVFYDVKTGGRAASEIVEGWEMSGQMIGQDIVGRAVCESVYEKPFGGIAVDAVRIGSTPDFLRRPINISTALHQPFMDAIVHYGKLLDTMADKDIWEYPRNHNECRNCNYTSLCRRGKFALGDFVVEER